MAATDKEFAEGIGRAFAGALLFSLPILMTMEMWWLGFSMEPWRLILMTDAHAIAAASSSRLIPVTER